MSDLTDPDFDKSQFASTVVRIAVEGGWIEIVPTVEESSDVPLLPLGLPVHVLSGCNPGYRATDDENARRHATLGERLHALGLEPRLAEGQSPDGTWIEPSWAVEGLARDAVCALGRDFDQVAVFEIDTDHMYVVLCSDGKAESVSRYSWGSNTPTVQAPF